MDDTCEYAELNSHDNFQQLRTVREAASCAPGWAAGWAACGAAGWAACGAGAGSWTTLTILRFDAQLTPVSDADVQAQGENTADKGAQGFAPVEKDEDAEEVRAMKRATAVNDKLVLRNKYRKTGHADKLRTQSFATRFAPRYSPSASGSPCCQGERSHSRRSSPVFSSERSNRLF